MDYTHATVPDGIDSSLTTQHQPGELPALTFARAVVEQVSATLWVTALDVDTRSGITVRLTTRITGQAVDAVLAWRAGRFDLSLAGRRDPLRRSGLARHSDGRLGALIDHDGAPELAALAEHAAAECLAETIVFGGTHAACERAGIHLDDVVYRCAQCGGLDVDAAVGAVPASARNRCASCRGTVTKPPARKPVRRRPAGVQGELFPRPERARRPSTSGGAVARPPASLD